MSDSLYCALASNSISFGPHGGSRPCCAVDTYFWQESKNVLPDYNNKIIEWFNNTDMVAIRSSLNSGKWNPVCNMCKTREMHGQASTRQIFNDTLQRVEETTGRNWRDSNNTITDLSNIFLLDITVGNKCNSACLMCNDSSSSLWAKEQEEITGNKFTSLNPNWFSEEHVPELIDNLPNLQAIQFVGGEPTISEAHVFLLKRLIDQGRSKDITLGYVTNLTGVSPDLLELWSHFSTKHITISIDGVGLVNEYIRYPFKWEKVVKQLDNLKSIAKGGGYNINLSHTITSLNLLTIDTMFEWWEGQVASGCGIIPSLPHMQCVNNPDYFNPIYMPKEMKEEAYESLQRFEIFTIKNRMHSKYLPAINNIRLNILEAEVNEEERKAAWLRMQNFLISLDKYRNRDIFKYLPFMEKYWIKE